MEENGGRGWRGKKSIKGKVLQKQMNGNFLNILLSIYLNRKYNQMDLEVKGYQEKSMVVWGSNLDTPDHSRTQ